MIFFLALVALVIAIVAFKRVNALRPLEHRVSELENDLTDLRRRYNVLQRQAAAPEPPEPPVPAPIERPAPPPPAPTPPAPTPPPQARPAPSTPPPPPVPASPPKPPIDWERWVGIRGAAVLGGIALALAGLLFFQYSIQHGLISTTMRVTLGFIAGLLCLGGSEWVRRRGYKPASEGLAGAGVVVLYAATWAAYARYQLIPLWLAFLLMALVTATCGLLAVRRAAPLVAVLGTVGGFATPLLLSIERDRPLGLFGYVLLLDLGLLAVGRRRQWGWLGVLGLAGTLVLQVVWLGAHTVGPAGLFAALAILGVFAIVFALAGFAKGAEGETTEWRAMQAGGLLAPFLFAIYFAARSDLGPHLWGIAAFAAILGVGASWSGRRAGMPALGLAAALGSIAILAVWLIRTPVAPGVAWEAAAIACGFAAIYHVFVERGGPSEALDGPGPAAIVAAAGGLVVLLVASFKSPTVPPWPWLAAWIVLGAFLVRQAALTGVAGLLPCTAAAVAAAFSLQHVIHGRSPAFPSRGMYVAAAVAIALLAQVVPFLQRAESRRMAEHGAALAAGILSFSLALSPLLVSLPTAAGLGVPLVLGVLMLLSGTRLGEGAWGLGAVLTTAFVHAAWTFGRPAGSLAPASVPLALLAMLVAVVVFVAWPFLARSLASTRWIWWAAAVAAPLWFLPLNRLWTIGPGPSTIGVVPLALGALTLAAAFGARRASGIAEEARRSALVGLSAVAICFASVAIPLQLDKSWITIGWALEGLGLVLLWKRLDHPGLKWFGLAHLMAAAVRLAPTEALLDSYPRSGTPIVNWLLYTYLVPAAAMLASAWILAPDEVARARPSEKELYGKGRPIGSIVGSLAGILTIFVWINLAIADWYADGPRLTLQFGRAPARDLTVSIAWAAYALVLLGFGMARGRTGLRWVSLGFLLVTIAKVFLYDLGELRDLYRVLSLVGLALSLLLVSVLYQRFVFRRPAEGSR